MADEDHDDESIFSKFNFSVEFFKRLLCDVILGVFIGILLYWYYLNRPDFEEFLPDSPAVEFFAALVGFALVHITDSGSQIIEYGKMFIEKAVTFLAPRDDEEEEEPARPSMSAPAPRPASRSSVPSTPPPSRVSRSKSASSSVAGPSPSVRTSKGPPPAPPPSPASTPPPSPPPSRARTSSGPPGPSSPSIRRTPSTSDVSVKGAISKFEGPGPSGPPVFPRAGGPPPPPRPPMPGPPPRFGGGPGPLSPASHMTPGPLGPEKDTPPGKKFGKLNVFLSPSLCNF